MAVRATEREKSPMEKVEGRIEAVLVAADRVHEAYAAMLEGRDLGGLAEWTRESDPSGELRRLRRAILHVTAHNCQWGFVSDEDPDGHENCSLCGAQRNRYGPMVERAGVTGGWPLPVSERDRQVAELREALEFTVLTCCALEGSEGPVRPLELEESPCEGCERAMAVLASSSGGWA